MRRLKTPRIVVHIAQSVDGRISFRHGSSKKKWENLLGSETPKVTPLWSRVLRKEIKPDALLSGSRTLTFGTRERRFSGSGIQGRTSREDYLPAAIIKSVQDRKRWSGWHVVVDSRGRVPWQTRELTFWGQRWHPLALVSLETPASYLRLLRRMNVPYLVAGSTRVDLKLAMKKLRAKLKVAKVASLGGGKLNGTLLRAGLVDEISVILIPMLVSGESTPTSFDAPDLGFSETPVFLRLTNSQVQEDGSIWLRYVASK